MVQYLRRRSLLLYYIGEPLLLHSLVIDCIWGADVLRYGRVRIVFKALLQSCSSQQYVSSFTALINNCALILPPYKATHYSSAGGDFSCISATLPKRYRKEVVLATIRTASIIHAVLAIRLSYTP